MTLFELLEAISQAGVTLSVRDGTRLIVSADQPAPMDLLAEIRRYKPLLVEMFGRTRWDVALADAWIQITLERVSRWHDQIAPDCPGDGPGWDEAEAQVDAAYVAQDRLGLRAALDAYERYAREAFDAWAAESADEAGA